MAIAFLNSVAAQSGDGANVTTGSVDTSGANLIVVLVASHEPSAAPTLTDSKGNTWTGLTVQQLGPPRARLFYSYAPTVGSGHTFTLAGTSSFPSVAAIWFSGAASSPFDQENGFTTGVATSGQPGSVTPTEDNEVIIAGMASNSASGYSIDAPFTAEENLNIIGGQAYGIFLAYSIQTTATARNPTFSFVSGASAMVQGTFKASVGGGAVSVPQLRRLRQVRNRALTRM